MPEPAERTPAEAERDALRRWKSEAMEVMDGLQELGTELHLPLGERITGPKAVEAVRALRVERDALRGRLQAAEAREAIRHKIGGLDELLRERDNLLEQLVHYEESNPEDHCVYIEKLQGLRERIRALADECDVRQMGEKVERENAHRAKKGSTDEFFHYGKQRAWGEARNLIRAALGDA